VSVDVLIAENRVCMTESSEEQWMYFDEYEDWEAFDGLYKAAEDQPDLLYSDDPRKAAQLREEKRSLTVPGSSKKNCGLNTRNSQ
jgi:hypothetical protein